MVDAIQEKQLIKITNSREKIHHVRHGQSLQVVEGRGIELGAGENDDGGKATNKPEKHEDRPNK